MKTITFTPHHDIKTLNPVFVYRWSRALRKSKQFRGGFVSDDLQSQCCLAVGAEIDGADMAELHRNGNGNANECVEFTLCRNTNHASSLSAATGSDGSSREFAELNDYHLTHPQIADLLDGKTVTIQVSE